MEDDALYWFVVFDFKEISSIEKLFKKLLHDWSFEDNYKIEEIIKYFLTHIPNSDRAHINSKEEI